LLGGKVGFVETLKRCDVFLGLSDDDLRKIATLPSCREKTFEAGEIIFRAGSKAEELYVLNEGEINLMIETSPSPPQPQKQMVVNIVTQGCICSWSALVAPYILTLSAVCVTSSKVMMINGAELTALMDKEPYIGYEVMKGLVRVISSRLRNIEQMVIRGKRWPLLGD
jgi:CRP-like cAMP-binding protein